MSFKIVIECDGYCCSNSVDFDVELDDIINNIDGSGFFKFEDKQYCGTCAPVFMEENVL